MIANRQLRWLVFFLRKIRNQMENIIYRRIYLRKAVEYYRTYKSRKSKDI